MVECPGCEEIAVISDSDPEVKIMSCFASQVGPFTNLLERLQRFLDWSKAKGPWHLCLRLQSKFKIKGDNNILKRGTTNHRKTSKPLNQVNVEELHLAELRYLKPLKEKPFQKRSLYFTVIVQKERNEKEFHSRR